MFISQRLTVLLLCCWVVVGLGTPNLPYPSSWVGQKVVFAPFSGAPKTLDPAKSYSTDSNLFISQICEPPLEYHYLKRPYQLQPLAADTMPVVTFLDKNHQPTTLENTNHPVAYTQYDIYLRKDLMYAPHPALAKNSLGEYYYHNANSLANRTRLSAFPHQGSRLATADDFVYQIKRLASPKSNSPIFGVMAEHIVGFTQFNNHIQAEITKHPQWAKKDHFLDLRPYDLSGVKVVSPFHFQIMLKGQYRQFIYWLAMPFFAPVPWEVDLFYHLRGQEKNNIGFDWSPMGTGPFQLTENNPNQRMILARNPNYHVAFFPSEGTKDDKKHGYLDRSGKRLPLVDRFVFSLEKESVASWNKFLQGYYDRSGVSSDNFDQVIALSQQGDFDLSDHMKDQGVSLSTSVSPSIYFIGFNMLDPIVGGYTKQAQALRQAISIAINYEEYITIFLNGRGVPAQGPIPENIWGNVPGEAGINRYVYQWQDGHPVRRSLKEAKMLLAKAGYPGGIDPKTGQPLVLHYDIVSSSGPDDKARFSWIREQFAKLGIALDIRATQYNRFQDKIRQGQEQIFTWGWLADYPDPENFLFLLYGPNGKVKYHGENATNYIRKEYDQCFEKMRNMPDGVKRQRVLDRCVDILRQDAPWVWGFFPKSFVLAHHWVSPIKPNAMAGNLLKYYNVKPDKRVARQKEWNQPHWISLIYLCIVIAFTVLIILKRYRQSRKSLAGQKKKF